MTMSRELKELIVDDKWGGFSLGRGIESRAVKAVPVGRPFIVDAGCPRDSLPWYHSAFGSNVYNELLKCSLPHEANAYVCSSKSIFFEDFGAVNVAFQRKKDHVLVAVQLYRLV